MRRILTAIVSFLVLIIAISISLPYLYQSDIIHAQSPTKNVHYVIFTKPVLQSSGRNKMVVTHSACYTSYSDAIYAATGGKVRLPKDMQPGKTSHDLINTSIKYSGPKLNTYPFLELYQNSNRGGNSATYTSSSPVCTNNLTYFGNIGVQNGFNMNDQASSFALYGSCFSLILYADQNENNLVYIGSVYAYNGNNQVNNIYGPMNDQASSYGVTDNCFDSSSCVS